jgi:hypothetical protein
MMKHPSFSRDKKAVRFRVVAMSEADAGFSSGCDRMWGLLAIAWKTLRAV